MIRNYKLFLGLGLITLVIPFLGIPEIFKNIILFAVGFILIILGLVYRSVSRRNSSFEEETFLESGEDEDVEEDSVLLAEDGSDTESVDNFSDDLEGDYDDDESDDDNSDMYDDELGKESNKK